MKIVAIYRHYWPDATPYARILKCILEEQVRQGHQVVVLTAQPSYNDIKFSRRPPSEVIEGVEVLRRSLLPERKHWRVVRALNSVLFLVWAVWKSLGRRDYDVVIANTHPPVLMGLALQVIKFITRLPYILHCQDIHPESAALAKQVKASWLVKLLKRFDTASCRQARRIVTLSEDMKQTLMLRDTELEDSITVLNNFGLDDVGVVRRQRREGDDFQLIFAGNLGKFQGLDKLVVAISLLGNELPIELLLLGTGSEAKRLKDLSEKLGVTRIRFVGYQSPDVAAQYIQQADLGIVSLSEGVCRVAYPSKTMAYTTAGCPILSIVEKDSQVARDVQRLNLGYVPLALSPEGISEAIRTAWHDRSRWNADERMLLAKRAEREFGISRALGQWNDLFASLDTSQHLQRSTTMNRRVA